MHLFELNIADNFPKIYQELAENFLETLGKIPL